MTIKEREALKQLEYAVEVLENLDSHMAQVLKLLKKIEKNTRPDK